MLLQSATMFSVCFFVKKKGFSVLEIHSRKSQGHRTKVTERFRNGRGLIMFTSDVSARGMDYPDVSAVLQASRPLINPEAFAPQPGW